MIVITCALYLLCSRVVANDLFRTVQILEHGVNPNTVVYYDLKENSSLEQLLQQSTLPHLVLREGTGSELAVGLNSKVLSIVFIENYYNISLMDSLGKTLRRWQESDIIFVASLAEGKELEWKWLFTWCWSKGFYNVLLVSSDPSTKSLILFNKFPEFITINITPQDYITLYRNKWGNFEGYPIRAGFYHLPPRAILYEYNNQSVDQKFVVGGIGYHTIKMFTERYNASLLLTVLFKSIDETFQMLNTAEIDISLLPVGYKSGELYFIVDISDLSPVYLLVPYAQPLEKYKYFLLPFDKATWFAILLTLGFLSVAISLLRLRHSGIIDLGASLLETFEIILYSGVRIPGSGKRRFFIFVIAILTGFIITNLYLAYLSSFLSTIAYEKQIETIEDLSTHNITVIYSSLWKNLNARGISKELYRQMRAVDTDFYMKSVLNLDSRYAYICKLETCSFFLHQQFLMSVPRVRLITEPIIAVTNGYPVRFDWPFKELFKRFILNLYSSGISEYIERYNIREAVKWGVLKLHRDIEDDVKPLRMEDFYVMIIILAIGYSISLVIFCLENLIFYSQKIILKYLKN